VTCGSPSSSAARLNHPAEKILGPDRAGLSLCPGLDAKHPVLILRLPPSLLSKQTLKVHFSQPDGAIGAVGSENIASECTRTVQFGFTKS
jgi:hypothetical protein